MNILMKKKINNGWYEIYKFKWNVSNKLQDSNGFGVVYCKINIINNIDTNVFVENCEIRIIRHFCNLCGVLCLSCTFQKSPNTGRHKLWVCCTKSTVRFKIYRRKCSIETLRILSKPSCMITTDQNPRTFDWMQGMVILTQTEPLRGGYSPRTNSHCSHPRDLSGTTSNVNILSRQREGKRMKRLNTTRRYLIINLHCTLLGTRFMSSLVVVERWDAGTRIRNSRSAFKRRPWQSTINNK